MSHKHIPPADRQVGPTTEAFLPVEPFWLEPTPRRRAEQALCWGIVIGSALTLVIACGLICLVR